MPERRFFRIVRSDPPTLDDFRSHAARGRVLRPGADAETGRLWSGVSVYATEAQGRRHAKSSPMLGTYLAELEISEPGTIQCERTGGHGHYTLWGEPAELLRCVIRISLVRPRIPEDT